MSQHNDQGPTNIDRNLSIEDTDEQDPMLAAALQLSLQQQQQEQQGQVGDHGMDVEDDDTQQKQATENVVGKKVYASNNDVANAATDTTPAVKHDDEDKQPKKKKKKKSKKRCWHDDCKAKLKLTDMECKCKHRYCGKHRMMEHHDCEYLKTTSNKEIYKAKMQGLGGGQFTKLETM